MATPKYPANLPGPMSFSMTPAPQLALSDVELGPQAVRSRTRDPGATASVRFRYLLGEYAVFISWLSTEVRRGLAWFRIRLPSAGGITWHYARFLALPQAKLQGHRYFEVSADLEVRERQFKPLELDPFAAQVVSLIHFEDPDGTLIARDEIGLINWRNTATDISTVRASAGRFGGGLARASSYSTSLAGGLRTIGRYSINGPFTAELFVRISSYLSGGQASFFGFSGDAFAVVWVRSSSTVTEILAYNSNGYSPVCSAPAISGYTHVAMTYEPGTAPKVRLFVGGIPGSEGILPSPITAPLITVGSSPNNDDWYTGGIDEWRLTEAVRYRGPFTPPTEPFPDP